MKHFLFPIFCTKLYIANIKEEELYRGAVSQTITYMYKFVQRTIFVQFNVFILDVSKRKKRVYIKLQGLNPTGKISTSY